MRGDAFERKEYKGFLAKPFLDDLNSLQVSVEFNCVFHPRILTGEDIQGSKVTI
jgi:hypothetical protein